MFSKKKNSNVCPGNSKEACGERRNRGFRIIVNVVTRPPVAISNVQPLNEAYFEKHCKKLF